MVKQMSDTDKQWNDVNDAAANQEAKLEKALQQVEDIQEALRKADQAMSKTEEKVKDLPPVGADVDTINQQLEDIKVSGFGNCYSGTRFIDPFTAKRYTVQAQN